MDYTDDQIDNLMKGIYHGEISVENLPEDLYLAIADRLEKAVYEGFGGSAASFTFGGPDFKMVEALRENVYMFSGAKTFQQCKEMQELIISTDSFKEFKEEAMKVYNRYNVDWLEAEYNTAIGQSQSARDWSDIQEKKDLLPILRYSAVVDENTSEICQGMDGVTKPVDDPIWDVYSPLNHYNCRCLLEQLDEDNEEVDVPVGLEKPDPVFAKNPGKTGEVFNEDHPYFDVEKPYKELARENFGLPIPEYDDN